MKEKVSAIISFLSGIGWGLFILFLIIENKGITNSNFLPFFLVVIASISTTLYVIWTKFGQGDRTDLEKIEYENQILKKQIEKKELLKKLKD